MRAGAGLAARGHLIRFFEVMRGCLVAAPSRLEPVMKMPLRQHQGGRVCARPWRAGVRYTLAHGAPGRPQDGQAHALADADGAPEVGADVLEQEEEVVPVDGAAVVRDLRAPSAQ